MIEFIKKFIANKQARSNYIKLLNEFLKDGKLDLHERKELEEFCSIHKIDSKALKTIYSNVLSAQFNTIISDKLITEDEKNSLQELMEYFQVDVKDYKFDQKQFNKYYSLGLIEKGILPTVEKVENFNFILKRNEIIHWGCKANLLMFTQHKYVISAFSSNIKIAKGLNYRVGSYSKIPSNSIELTKTDLGFLWITNQRLAYQGNVKSWAIDLNKIISINLAKEGLIIYKQSRETPYILELEDFEVPSLLVSKLLNQD